MKTLLAGLFLLAVMSTAASVAGQEFGPTAEPTVYTRNTNGRIETVTTPKGTTRYSYFPDGEIQQVIHPDGSREVYDYEELVAARKLVARLAAEDAQASGRPASTASTLTSSENAFDVSANRFAFAGYSFDRETGLYYVGARYFDPAIGRFITADSNLGRMDDPPSLNRFVYGHNRPTYFVDPTGHEVGTAGCYFGPSSCSPFEPVPITGVEKRAFAGLVATARWAGKAALGTLNLALGRGWEGFGERVITAASDPRAALIAAKEGFEEHVNTELDIAQERLAKGDDFGAALRFTEEVTAPTAATVIGASELAVGAMRTGSRLLATKAAASAKAPPTFVSDGGVALEEVGSASAPFVVGEQGLVPAIRGGSQGADALAEITRRSAPPARPSWQAAEAASSTDLREFGFREQRSYRGGQEVPYGTPGSVRPDLTSEGMRLSVDVKNYDLATPQGRYRLVREVVRQTEARAVNLPKGMRQAVAIDVRGQQISEKLLNSMIERIIKQSNGLVQADNIHVRR
jgi:RHS repeat-associated protein